MRKLVALVVVFGLAASIGATEMLAQDESATGFQVLKEKFIQGDWKYMAPILICLIIGLAFCIERIITLNLATANTDKLLTKIDGRLAEGDLEGALEVCKSTSGPAEIGRASCRQR